MKMVKANGWETTEPSVTITIAQLFPFTLVSPHIAVSVNLLETASSKSLVRSVIVVVVIIHRRSTQFHLMCKTKIFCLMLEAVVHLLLYAAQETLFQPPIQHHRSTIRSNNNNRPTWNTRFLIFWVVEFKESERWKHPVSSKDSRRPKLHNRRIGMTSPGGVRYPWQYHMKAFVQCWEKGLM